MAQLKTTNITGNLSVTGDILASKLTIFGGTGSLMLDNGSKITFSANKTTKYLNENGQWVTPDLDANLAAIAALTGTSGLLKKTAANKWELDTNTYLTTTGTAADSSKLGGVVAASYATQDWVSKNYTNNTGTVTSIIAGTGLSGDTITTTGTIGLANNYGDTKNPYASKTKNHILAAPNGSDGVPTFRALVEADIPSLASSKITGLANVATTGKYSDLTGTPTITDEKVATSSRGATDTYYLTGTSGNVTGKLKYDDNIKFGTTVGELHMKICNLNTAEAPARLSYDSTLEAIKFTFS